MIIAQYNFFTVMLATTHSFASALIVTKIPNPYISLPLVIVFHYLLDLIPHWDTGTGLTTGKKTKKRALILTAVDIIIAVVSVFYFFQFSRPFSPLLWIGVILGIMPDILEFPALFFKFRPFPINVLEKFHSQIMHTSGKMPWGLILQIPLIISFILLR